MKVRFSISNYQWGSKLGLLLILIIGLILSLARKNMFVVWLGLELKMFRIIPFITNNTLDTKNVIYVSSDEIKVSFFYFFIQVLGSLLFLCGCILSNWYLIRVMGLLMKLGLPPFFQWVPILIARIDWFCIGLIGTIQKIPGVLLLRLIFDLEFRVCLTIGLLGLGISAIGINSSYKNLKKLVRWSSISNMRILILLITIKKRLGVLYYFYYCVLVISFCALISFSPAIISKIKVSNFILLIFSGAPPFLGFLFKLCFIKAIYIQDNYFSMYKVFLVLAPYYLDRWMIVFAFLLLIVLQAVGYIKAFIKIKFGKVGRYNSKKGSYYRSILELVIYLGCVLMIWY